MAQTHEAKHAPGPLSHRLLSYLSLDWIAILLDLYRALRLFLSRERREGMYEILDYDSTLELMDPKGEIAVFKKRQRVKFLQDSIIAFEDYAWGDGEIFSEYKCSPGKVVDRHQEGDRWNVLISLRETKSAGDIEVLLQTGMRLSELAGSTLTDVEIPRRVTRSPDNTGTVRVLRKGGRTQLIPLNYKACQALAAWLTARPEVDHEALFVTKFKAPMSPRAIQYRVKKYLDEAGIKGASVHTLRHTMATHHVARGTDLKTLQVTLGHADLATTSIYVSLAKKAQRQALQEHAL